MHAASLLAAAVVALVIPLQLAAVAGAPVAGLLYGGRAGAAGEPLPPMYRGMSAVAVGVLAAFVALFLMAGGWLVAPVPQGVLRVACGVMAAFLGLNTLGNLAGAHWVERRLMAAITAYAAVVAAWLALS